MDSIQLLKQSRWQRYGDLILFRACVTYFFALEDSQLDEICKEFKCKRIAVLRKINPDEYRTPQVKLIKGHDPWVLHVENKIKYSFNIEKCMFSKGNISEKLRIAKIDCSNEIVVDLFCGIGYFTLPFLVHCNALKVYACDWNQNAIEALNKNLILNKVEQRCEVRLGDSREVAPVSVAQRVYLGLIPSSEIGWRTACKALNKTTGGILHIHENINTFGKNNEAKKACWIKKGHEIIETLYAIFADILPHQHWKLEIKNMFRVKSYAPHIDHMVFDIFCKTEIK